MSRNTQGGLGHRLRGRRRGNARHRHQLSSSGGGSRTGEMERREKKEKGANWVGRGFSLVTPQSSRARRMRRAEAGDNQGEKKNGNTAARVEPESVGRRCQRRQYLYPEGGARDVTDGRSAARRGRGLCRRGMWEGRKRKDSLAQLGAEGRDRWALQVLARRSLPALARPAAPRRAARFVGGAEGARPGGSRSAPSPSRRLRCTAAANDPLCERAGGSSTLTAVFGTVLGPRLSDTSV